MERSHWCPFPKGKWCSALAEAREDREDVSNPLDNLITQRQVPQEHTTYVDTGRGHCYGATRKSELTCQDGIRAHNLGTTVHATITLPRQEGEYGRTRQSLPREMGDG